MSRFDILGAGNMGVLAASYLARAGLRPRFLITGGGAPLQRELDFDADGRRQTLRFDTADPQTLSAPVEHLIVATKAWQTAAALQPLSDRLAPSVELVRMQNGIGSLDDVQLPDGARVIEAVTTSGAWRDSHRHHVVAENATLIGDGRARPPAWLQRLQPCWPGLEWRIDIRHQQLLKLSVNAVINPLTALHDCDNGDLAARPELRDRMNAIAAEVDAVLGRLDPEWHDDTLRRSLDVARATAANTSSMRSDLRAGRTTEIDYINGWLVRKADLYGISVPENRRLFRAVRDRHP